MEKAIEDLTKAELLDDQFIPSIFKNYQEDEERNDVLKQVLVVAKGKGACTRVQRAIQKCNSEIKMKKVDDGLLALLTFDNTGRVEPTIDNYKMAILNDKEIFDDIKYNDFSHKFERWEDGKFKRNWQDEDDDWVLYTIEKKYNFYSDKKYARVLSQCIPDFKYHPIKDVIEAENWDGISRIDKFLSFAFKCEDDDYHREVSRMIFYGGISRLYEPGCKFEYMPIFISNQGVGKSLMVKFLAIDDKYFREINAVSSKDDIDNMTGGWICEMPEMTAFAGTSDNAMKAFISTEVDRFRRSYGRNIVEIPRHNIIIGTTNSHEFLSDRSGNRRYLPVEIEIGQGEIWDRQEEIKSYILNCWREALFLYKRHKIYLSIPSKYNEAIEGHRRNATYDDPKEGIVREYLSSKEVGDKVCLVQIHVEAFNELQKKMGRGQSIDLATIMDRFPEWKKRNGTHRFAVYGSQRYWEKVE